MAPSLQTMLALFTFPYIPPAGQTRRLHFLKFHKGPRHKYLNHRRYQRSPIRAAIPHLPRLAPKFNPPLCHPLQCLLDTFSANTTLRYMC